MRNAVALLTNILFFSIASFAYDEAGFHERSLQVIDKVADEYNPPSPKIGDPEKYYFPKVIARFEKYGINDTLANRYIEMFQNNSPFHFTLVGAARIICLYKDAPAVKKTRLRYLQEVWKRTDSYNAWTAEGTENHINMSRTSGYIFAMCAREYYPNEFKDAGEKMHQMKEWMMKWAKTIFSMGTAEWNSSIYEPYNFIGWLNIYDFAKDPELKAVARAVLDYYAAEIAIHYFHGALGGPEMRGGGVSGLPSSAAEYYGWLWYGNTKFSLLDIQNLGSDCIQNVHAITSSYRPTEEMVQLAQKRNFTEEVYHNSKPSYLYDKASYIRQSLFIHEQFILGSSQVPYGGYMGSSFQVVQWKLLANSTRNLAPYILTGNGTYHDAFNGRTRDPYTQIAQHKNILVQLSRLPENYEDIEKQLRGIINDWSDQWQKDFKRRFPKDQYKLEHSPIKVPQASKRYNGSYVCFNNGVVPKQLSGRYFLDFEEVFVAITPVRNSGGMRTRKESNSKFPPKPFLLDSAPAGSYVGFVIETGLKSESESFDVFCREILKKAKLDTVGLSAFGKISYTSLKGDNLEVIYQISGTITEALADWGFGVTRPMVFMEAPPFKQPTWPSGAGFGRIPTLKINGRELDTQKEWPVFSGMRYTLKNGLFELRAPESIYKIDFTGNVPVFSSEY